MSKPEAVRAAERYPVKVSVEVRHPRAVRRIEAELCDLSTGGCCIVSPEPFAIGDQLLLRIGDLEPWPGAVAWLGEDCAGVSFHAPLDHLVAEHCGRIYSLD